MNHLKTTFTPESCVCLCVDRHTHSVCFALHQFGTACCQYPAIVRYIKVSFWLSADPCNLEATVATAQLQIFTPITQDMCSELDSHACMVRPSRDNVTSSVAQGHATTDAFRWDQIQSTLLWTGACDRL